MAGDADGMGREGPDRKKAIYPNLPGIDAMQCIPKMIYQIDPSLKKSFWRPSRPAKWEWDEL